jgi:large subunit ribosomal protein L18
VIGKLIAERSLEADVYAVAFELRKGEKLEGKLAVVIDTAREHGLSLV